MIWPLVLAAALALAANPPPPGPEPAPLHTPLDRAFTAQRIYADCLAANSIRLGGATRADPVRVVRRARSFCRAEARDMDEVGCAARISAGLAPRGTDSRLLEQIDREAIARLRRHRAGARG